MKIRNFTLAILIVCASHVAFAGSKDMLKYVPQNTFFVVGADFDVLRTSDVFVKLENEGRVWSFDKRNNLMPYLQALTLKPADIQASVFSKYLNSYGAKGECHLFQITRDISGHLANKSSTPYLNFKIYRIQADEELYAAVLNPQTVALGSLNGVKMSVDVMQGKEKQLKDNQGTNGLIEKLPHTAGVWGISRPLSRKEAASRGTSQSTNTMLEAFENYYFYGVPSRTSVRAHFIGFAKSEGEATFVRTFMIGMVTFAKFRASNDKVSDALDQIAVDRNGKNIHVTATVNQALVDAYLNGELGVE
jgi:hypothetical protein